MSVIAAALKHMFAAGMAPEAIVAAVEDMERAAEPTRTKRQERNARYYESRKERLKTSEIKTVKTVSDVSDAERLKSDAPADEPRARVVNTTLPSEEVSNIPPLVPPSEETAPRKASRAKPRTTVAPDLEPNERNRSDATAAGLTGREAREEWRRFIDFHTAKGSLMASWDAAWRTWLGNRNRFARAGPGHQLSVLSRIAMMDCPDEPTDQRNASPAPCGTDPAGARTVGPVSERLGEDRDGPLLDFRPTGTGWR